MRQRTTPSCYRLAIIAWLLATSAGTLGAAFDQSGEGYVNNDLCLGCHAREALAWRNSDHAKAMQFPSPATVLGDFNNTVFNGEGLTARFHHEDNRYQVTIQEAGQEETLDVAWTFGVHPLQQYLLALPNGRLQAFPVAWDTQAKRWFHLQSGEGVHAGDALHWRNRFFTANSFCIECHTTHYRLGYDSDTGHYNSHAAGHNVNCQACHGPGEDHIAWTRQPGTTSDKGWHDRPLADPSRVIDVCGTCHSRRHPITPTLAWAAPLLDNVMPALLRDPLYYPDGQIHDEVYVTGSFLQSKMHAAGVTCLDCHNPHSLQTRATGNGLCTSCHEHGNPRFPVLKPGHYDTPEHHHHAAGSAGSQCVNCHMPTTTYMKVDPRRDHRFGIPRPDLTPSLGTPNACNQCHTDRDAHWAQAAIAGWYPQGRSTQPDRGTVIAAAREGQPSAIPPLQAMAHNPAEPAIWRATAIELLSAYGPGLLESLVTALKDPSPLVRNAAVSAFAIQPAAARQQYLPALLHDPSRAVRMEAANQLADIPLNQLPVQEQAAWQQAMQEYRAAQSALPDHPEGYANLGNLAYRQGNDYEAIRRMKQAIATDAHFIPAYQSLAVLYSRIGATDRAVETLQQALQQALPEQRGGLYYTLGLAQAELHNMPAARQALEQAITADPGHVAAHYNLGLVLQQLGEIPAACEHLQHALTLVPQDDRTAFALAQCRLRQDRPADALPLLERLQSTYPQDATLKQLITETRQRLSR